jgi:serine/threonine-protein kinase PpkA
MGPTSPEQHRVPAGVQRVRVEKPGYLPFQRQLDLTADSTETVRATLIPAPQLVSITGGCFQMGSPASEAGREDDERQHRVCVDDFKLAQHEVTVAAFRAFVEASGYRTDAERNVGSPGCYAYDQSDKDNNWAYRAWASWRKPNKYQPNQDAHPVSCVSWNDAQTYLAWLNEQSSARYRLPTEAEWEYAARAGTRTARFWGNDANAACSYANVADTTKLPNNRGWNNRHECSDGHAFVTTVGRYRANAWGLHDLLGNVSEWTCSQYDAGYGGAEGRCTNANGSGSRALRGGSWDYDPQGLRSAYRGTLSPDNRTSYLGFRLAQD